MPWGKQIQIQLKSILTIILLVVLSSSGFSQRLIKGKVIASDNGEGLPGVNFIIKGTNKGGSTDLNGNFSLEVRPEDKIITFSFVGYEDQDVEILDKQVIDVTLKAKSTTIDELVVVGYGVQKKSDITGATSQVKGNELTKQPVLTAALLVRFLLPGL